MVSEYIRTDPPTACRPIVSGIPIDDSRPAGYGVALSRRHTRTRIVALAWLRIVYSRHLHSRVWPTDLIHGRINGKHAYPGLHGGGCPGGHSTD